MKHYAWDPARNEWLKRERGVSFEDGVDLFEHPNQPRYPGQQVSVALTEGPPYQALVSSVLHKFVEGRMVEQPSGKGTQRSR